MGSTFFLPLPKPQVHDGSRGETVHYFLDLLKTTSSYAALKIVISVLGFNLGEFLFIVLSLKVPSYTLKDIFKC